MSLYDLISPYSSLLSGCMYYPTNLTLETCKLHTLLQAVHVIPVLSTAVTWCLYVIGCCIMVAVSFSLSLANILTRLSPSLVSVYFARDRLIDQSSLVSVHEILVQRLSIPEPLYITGIMLTYPISPIQYGQREYFAVLLALGNYCWWKSVYVIIYLRDTIYMHIKIIINIPIYQ